jgi:hypothetical protein
MKLGLVFTSVFTSATLLASGSDGIFVYDPEAYIATKPYLQNYECFLGDERNEKHKMLVNPDLNSPYDFYFGSFDEEESRVKVKILEELGAAKISTGITDGESTLKRTIISPFSTPHISMATGDLKGKDLIRQDILALYYQYRPYPVVRPDGESVLCVRKLTDEMVVQNINTEMTYEDREQDLRDYMSKSTCSVSVTDKNSGQAIGAIELEPVKEFGEWMPTHDALVSIDGNKVLGSAVDNFGINRRNTISIMIEHFEDTNHMALELAVNTSYVRFEDAADVSFEKVGNDQEVARYETSVRYYDEKDQVQERVIGIECGRAQNSSQKNLK